MDKCTRVREVISSLRSLISKLVRLWQKIRTSILLYRPLVSTLLHAFISMSFNSIGIWYVDQKGWIDNERSLARVWGDDIFVHSFVVYPILYWSPCMVEFNYVLISFVYLLGGFFILLVNSLSIINTSLIFYLKKLYYW